MLEFQAAEIEKARCGPARTRTCGVEKVRQANAGRLLALSSEAYEAPLRGRGRRARAPARAFKRVEELAALDPAFASYLEAWPALKAQVEDLAFALRDYRDTHPGDARPARRDRVAPGADRAPQAQVRRERRRDPRLRRGLPPAARTSWATPRSASARCAQALDERAPERYLAGGPRPLARAPRGRARRSRSACRRELKLLAMEKTRFEVRFVPDRPPAGDDALARRSWTERGLEQAEFLMSPEPRRGAAAAGPHRVGRRAVAHPARPQVGGQPGRDRQDARVRRGRRGHRRARRRRRRPQAAGHRRAASGPVRDAPSADRVARRPALRRREARRARPDPDRGACPRAKPSGSRRSRVCWEARPSATRRAKHARDLVKQA